MHDIIISLAIVFGVITVFCLFILLIEWGRKKLYPEQIPTKPILDCQHLWIRGVCGYCNEKLFKVIPGNKTSSDKKLMEK